MIDEPLGSLLAQRTDRDRMLRMWRSLKARRARRRRIRVAIAVASALAIGALALTIDRSSEDLRTLDGTRLRAFREGTTRLADGSSVRLGRGARLEVIANDPSSFDTVLRHGRATFAVRPGGDRRWTIDCGLATVRVIGTRFSIERTDRSLRVEVTRGAVSVRGERVPGLARDLSAGEAIVIEDDEPIAPVAPVRPVPVDAPRAESENEQPPARRSHRAPREAPPAIVEEDAEALLARADDAREDGRHREAIALLERILSEHPETTNAALAAFTLGVLRADSLAQHARAAQMFERALAMRLPSSLVPDALARLARARSESADADGARDAAARYLREHPRGVHADAMRELMEAR